MGQTSHGHFFRNLKGDMCTSKDKPDYKGINVNTDLIEYVPKIPVKKEVRKNPKHVATVFNSIQPLPLPKKTQ